MNSEEKCSFLSAIMASKLLSLLRNNDKYESFHYLLKKILEFLYEKNLKYIEESDVQLLESFLKEELHKFDVISFGQMDKKNLSFSPDSLNSIAKILIIFQIYILGQTTTITELYDFKSICKDLSKNRLIWDEQKNENLAIMILLSLLEVNLTIHLENNKNVPTKYVINNAYEDLNIYYEHNNFYHERIDKIFEKEDEVRNRNMNVDIRDNHERKEKSLNPTKEKDDKKKKKLDNSPNVVDANEHSINNVPEFTQSSNKWMKETNKNFDPKETCYKGETINNKTEEFILSKSAKEKDTDNGEQKRESNQDLPIEKKKLPKRQHCCIYEKKNAECKICGLIIDYNYFFNCEKNNQKYQNIVCKFCFPFLLKIELLLSDSEYFLNYTLKGEIDCLFSHECHSNERIQITYGKVFSEDEIHEISDYHQVLKEKLKEIKFKNCEKCNDYHPLRICQKLKAEYQHTKNLRACLYCYRPNRMDSKEKYEKCWGCDKFFCSSCFQLKESIEYHPNEYLHNISCKYSKEKFDGKLKSQCTVCENKENKCQRPLSNEEFLK